MIVQKDRYFLPNGRYIVIIGSLEQFRRIVDQYVAHAVGLYRSSFIVGGPKERLWTGLGS